MIQCMVLTDDTAADSTQGPQTKESEQTVQPETSSREQAESRSSVVEKDADQVGSTDNGVSSAQQRHEDVEMLPESSSSEAEPSSASSLQPAKQVEPVEQVIVVSKK